MWNVTTGEPVFSVKGPDYQYLYSVLARRVSVAYVLARQGRNLETCDELQEAMAIIRSHESAMNTTGAVATGNPAS